VSFIWRLYDWFVSIEWTSEAVTAAATVVITVLALTLAGGTLGLWFATRRLVKGAEETAKHQLRAYVFVLNGRVDLRKWGNTDDFCCRFVVELKNFGQTPARKYTTWVEHVIDDINAVPFTRPPPIVNRRKATIVGPSASTTWDFRPEI
jgi:hypothetical protein